MTNREDDAPIGVPVWFEWTGSLVQMFAGKGTPKLVRIEQDARASVLVTNAVGEPEAWIAFDGKLEVSDEGAIELASRLAARYWDLSNSDSREVLDGWEKYPEAFTLMTLTPEKIRSGG